METVLIILAIVCAIVGIVGAIVPGLPGPPIGWAAFLCLWFASPAYSSQISIPLLVISGLFAIIVTILDFVVPAWGTKKFGGSKAGSRGSTIGLLVVMFLVPIINGLIGLLVTATGFGFLNFFLIPTGLLTLLAGPFLGAFIGEKTQHRPSKEALKSAFGSFIGFLAGTMLKLFYGIFVLIYVVVVICKGLF